MNRIKYIIAMVMMMCVFACSGGYTDGASDTEDISGQKEALVTCTKPSSSLIGDNTSPFSSYIYAIHAYPAQPWKLEVEEKNINTGIVTVKYVDFGGISEVNSQAAITGPGWTGSSGQQIYELDFNTSNATLHALYPGCPDDSNYTCVRAYSTNAMNTPFHILTLDKRYSTAQGPYTFGGGLTAIKGLGDGTQKVAFTGDYGADGAYTQKILFTGPKLDACTYP